MDTTTEQVIEEAMADALGRVPTALQALRSYHGLTNAQIGDRIGKPMNWVQEHISGKTPCKVDDLARFAAGFGVPIDVLFRDRAEVIRWVLDSGLDLRSDPFGWTDHTVKCAA